MKGERSYFPPSMEYRELPGGSKKCILKSGVNISLGGGQRKKTLVDSKQ